VWNDGLRWASRLQLGWWGEKNRAGLLELWSEATEYPNRMDSKWWSKSGVGRVELVKWSGYFESEVLPNKLFILPPYPK